MFAPRESLVVFCLVDMLSGCVSRVDQKEDATPVRAEKAQVFSIERTDSEPVSALEIANPRQIKLLVPEKTFSADPETGALLLRFDDLNLLTVLDMETVTDDVVALMPKWMTSLDGKTVRIRGCMYPTFESEGIQSFVLMRDNQIMNYGAEIKIYNFMLIELKTGTTTEYHPLTETIDVVGRFKIELESENGRIYGLFRVEDASVIRPDRQRVN